MKINNDDDLETAKLTFSAMDQVDELEIGCEIWDVTFKIGENWLTGVMSRWPNDRGAFSANQGQSNWGEWNSPPACCDSEDDYLLLDVDQQDWKAIWVDDRGVEWIEVRSDDEFDDEEDEKPFWWKLKESYPAIHAKLVSCGKAMVTVEQFGKFEDIEGWDSGTVYPIKLV